MKVRIIVLAVFAVFGLALSVAGESDYHNCAMCKPMMAEPGLMQHVSWDSQEIATGMISVTTVDPEYAKAFDKAHAEMMKAAERLKKGEKLELCPMCTRMGALAEAGAAIEHVNAGGTRITAVTSQQAEVIEKIHAHMAWAQQASKKPDQHGG